MEKIDFTVKLLGEATIDSPLKDVSFEKKGAKILYHTDADKMQEYYEKFGEYAALKKAGPREKIFHSPQWSKAAILTAGGLCPGLNDVIKALTLMLYNHGVPVVYGIPYGYRGLDPKYGLEPILLTPDKVDHIHDEGGTILGSSRGNQDVSVMVDTLARMNINMLFCVGGDGTLRGAHKLSEEILRRKLNISVIGIPKTIDNDISFIDKTFGFETAVYATNPVITCAHNEAKGAYNGIGLVHVMGRDSGFIAAYAALANSDVNYCLIPEEKFTLEDGENAFLPHLFRRLEKRQHAVVLIAEGAGQDLFHPDEFERDASGNIKYKNIGRFLKSKILEYAEKNNLECSLKYFDPSYSIRSLPAHGTDAVLCSVLAQNAVSAAMSGCIDVVVGRWNGAYTLVPISISISKRKKVNLNGPVWQSVRSMTWPDYE